MDNIKVITLDALVVGSGAAGYSAAYRIKSAGKKSVALITEGVNMGTSRNTGSDKQTYYKLGLAGDSPDSVYKMASDLFACGSMDGDTALVEAALSPRCFLSLCDSGVPFPVNRYGEYVGYKTDHDPYARATSVGPLTSKYMTEALQKKCEQAGVTVYDGMLAVEVLLKEGRAVGILALNTGNSEYVIFSAGSILLSVGGPAGIYADSVYPTSHTGATSLAINAGAALQSLTEWQYGLASISPRWNVSGTYMQVLPRLVSIDKDGNEYEFLFEFFDDAYEALSMLFLKGYQWPFDSKKVMSGSSVIDLLVYRECVLRGRRVYLDYTKNPMGLSDIEYTRLSDEAFEYLKKAGALFGRPIDRLLKMNSPAVTLYRDKGVDIEREYLEIALCAQHSNGGIAVDIWWQSSVRGLFAAGECAGTHGVTRPGGSALNAGQVGALRAAEYISERGEAPLSENEIREIAAGALSRHNSLRRMLENGGEEVRYALERARRRMSDLAGAIRDRALIERAIELTEAELSSFGDSFFASEPDGLFYAYKLLDALTVSRAELYAMKDFSENVDGTRGSALYTDKNGSLREGLEEIFRFKTEDGASFDKVQMTIPENGGYRVFWRERRSIPMEDSFFENVWRSYRENKNIY